MSSIEILKQLENIPFQDLDFRQVLEDHLGILKEQSNVVEVPPALRDRYHGNFYGLLSELLLNLGFEYYWITMRVNDFVSPFDYEKGIGYIRTPPQDLILELYNRHHTLKKK